MKLLIVIAVVVYVKAYGEDACSWGPAHWCQSIRNAKQCGAMKHCTDTVWRTDQSYNTDDSDVCEFCENIIGDVRKFLTDNETEAAVRNYLDSACEVIPIEEVADECKDTVDNDLEELFDLIRSELDPKAVCSAMHICQSSSRQAEVHEDTSQLHHVTLYKSGDVELTNEPKDPSDLCPDCKKLMSDLIEMLADNVSVSQVEDMLKQELCANLGSLEQECNSLVEQYVPEILDALQSAIDPEELCTALGFCPGGDVLMLVKMKLRKTPLYQALAQAQVSTGEECTFCKLVFEELQELDRDTAVQQEVEDFVNTYLCAKLGEYKDVCVSTVEQYGQMVFELLATELDPDTRCQSLGFCATQLASSHVIRDAMPATKVKKPETSPGQRLGPSSGCVICEAVMMELKTMLENNETEAELLADLEKVCSIMPDTIKASCDEFVEKYGPAVVELLLQELDPQTICTILGLCSQTRKQNQGSGEMCGVCETIIQYLDSVLQQNSTEEQIKKDLERICNFLPDTIKEQCDTLVEEYMSLIIQLVAQGLTPKEVCTELGLCGSGSPKLSPFINDVPIVPQKAALVGVDECTYGPSFWCASKENAERCKATAHCQAKVWTQN